MCCAICPAIFWLTKWQRWAYNRGRRKFACSVKCRNILTARNRLLPFGWKKLSPKVLARKRVNTAIEYGKLVRPTRCEQCGNEPGFTPYGRPLIQAHHYAGYENALRVKWLCTKCHTKTDAPKLIRGSNHVNSKLTEENVKFIRACLLDGGSASKLAVHFCVSTATIKRIRTRQSWGHVL